MRISERLLTVLVLCLLVAAVPAFARGNGERELNEARALVDGKRYAQAMSLIVEIMEKFPDLREETDRLVARVMEVRRQFNEKYGDLLVILRKDDVTERDVDRGLAIVEELKKLDPNPDPAVTQALAIAVRALTERGKYKLFLVVMQDAAAQIAGGSTPRRSRPTSADSSWHVTISTGPDSPHCSTTRPSRSWAGSRRPRGRPPPSCRSCRTLRRLSRRSSRAR